MQVQPEARLRGLQRAQRLGHDFLANAVSGDDGDAVGALGHGEKRGEKGERGGAIERGGQGQGAASARQQGVSCYEFVSEPGGAARKSSSSTAAA